MGTGELLGNLTNCWGVTCDGLASRPVLAPKASLFLSNARTKENFLFWSQMLLSIQKRLASATIVPCSEVMTTWSQ